MKYNPIPNLSWTEPKSIRPKLVGTHIYPTQVGRNPNRSDPSLFESKLTQTNFIQTQIDLIMSWFEREMIWPKLIRFLSWPKLFRSEMTKPKPAHYATSTCENLVNHGHLTCTHQWGFNLYICKMVIIFNLFSCHEIILLSRNTFLVK